ncbi:MAG: thiopurine S-methyltransferase [Bordetella sp.]|nr:thiopurine S-methyltransferase [Bordetella sp.]
MDAEFWLERWRDGQTHFHQNRVTPLLQKYWPTLEVAPGSRVLVPLAGKSLDMVWLASQGLQVLGVELARQAVEQFFDENALTPTRRETPAGTVYTAGSVELLCGDIFGMDAALLGSCAAVYDRAALVALPIEMRARYVKHVYGQLAPDYRGVLITLEYDQHRMDGPPFSVGDAEVQSLYRGHSRATLIDRRDIIEKEPKFKQRGLERLDTLVYRLDGTR